MSVPTRGPGPPPGAAPLRGYNIPGWRAPRHNGYPSPEVVEPRNPDGVSAGAGWALRLGYFQRFALHNVAAWTSR